MPFMRRFAEKRSASGKTNITCMVVACDQIKWHTCHARRRSIGILEDNNSFPSSASSSTPLDLGRALERRTFGAIPAVPAPISANSFGRSPTHACRPAMITQASRMVCLVTATMLLLVHSSLDFWFPRPHGQAASVADCRACFFGIARCQRRANVR